MDNNVEFLNYIFQNAEMGYESINDLFDVIENKEFFDILESQKKEYERISQKASKLLSKHNKEKKEVSGLSKVSSYIMIKMNLLKDKSVNHIAEMMIKGSNMGIIEITKKLNSYKDADSEIIDLGEQLLEFEKENIDELTPFLKEKESEK